MRKTRIKFPARAAITGRKSTIINVFVGAITPWIVPEEEELVEAIQVLSMTSETIVCCYCGDPATEWDHLRPLVRNSEPTGYITEIANLVPSCSKCNQSKGGRDWRDWIVSSAPRSPKSRGIVNLNERIERIEAYEQWRTPRRIDFKSIIGEELWTEYNRLRQKLVEHMVESQQLANDILRSAQASLDG